GHGGDRPADAAPRRLERRRPRPAGPRRRSLRLRPARPEQTVAVADTDQPFREHPTLMLAPIATPTAAPDLAPGGGREPAGRTGGFADTLNEVRSADTERA